MTEWVLTEAILLSLKLLELMGIADDIDDVWDSGVFLEANSFSATGLMISAGFSSSSVGLKF